MLRCLSLILFFSIGTSIFAFGQNTYSISGIVSDNQGALPGVSIYVSGYKMATSTDNTGKFVLPKLAPGTYDILVQMIGYQPYKQKIVISDKSVTITVALKEDTTSLSEIVVKADFNRPDYVKLFIEMFIGKTPNSAQCELLNPNVLIFKYDREKEVLSARADELLVVENRALGYKIKYLLEGFEFNRKAKISYFVGQPFFEETEGTAAKRKRWIKSREIAYYGSRQHFLKSLFTNTTTQEGYIINKVYKTPNPKKIPDSIINANIKRLTEQTRKVTRVYELGFDSVAYWIRQRDEFPPLNNFDTATVKVDTLVKVYDKDMKIMTYKDALLVMYTKERETNSYFSSGNWQERPKGVPNYQVSIIDRTGPKILFYPNGSLPDPKSTLYQGYWAYERIGDMLPLDYVPQPNLNN